MNLATLFLVSSMFVQGPEGRLRVLSGIPDPPQRAQVALPLITPSGRQFICGKNQIVLIDPSGKAVWERRTEGEVVGCDIDSRGRL